MASFARLGALGLMALLASASPTLADDEPKPEGEPSAGAQEKATAEEGTGTPEIPEAEEGGRVEKTVAQWRRQLNAAQFYVTRMKGTEQAWSGKYSRGKHHGTFACVCCGAELFHSDHKFQSGTGWPSFWRPIRPERLRTQADYSGIEPRIEVECARCDAHLGHIFNDGPPPTGLRFCINSVALTLKQPTPARKAHAKPKADQAAPDAGSGANDAPDEAAKPRAPKR